MPLDMFNAEILRTGKHHEVRAIHRLFRLCAAGTSRAFIA